MEMSEMMKMTVDLSFLLQTFEYNSFNILLGNIAFELKEVVLLWI